MFDILSRALHDVQQRDEEKLLSRKSKRNSRLSFLGGPGETAPGVDGQGEENDDKLNEKRSSINVRRNSSPQSDELEEDDEDVADEHPRWDNGYIVVIFMIGFAVGGSNIWRFGTLMYEHGGVLFLIPYLFFTSVCALPCLYLELLIGQYAQVGIIAAWKLVPLFKGVGMCMLLLAFMLCFNFQSVLGWCIFYIFQSIFHSPLPWISCDNGFGILPNGQMDPTKEKWIQDEHDDENLNWHTENCTEFYADSGTSGSLGEFERLTGTEYFRIKVVGNRGRVQRMWMSGYADRAHHRNFTQDNGVIIFGIHNREQGMLEYNRDTFICLVFVFFIMIICIARGTKMSPTLMANIVLGPYILIILLFYRATGLTGAWDGLHDLFKPNVSKLFATETWWRAAEQVYYSTGAGFGIHLTLASHNYFNRRIVYDATITVLVNVLTSLVSACTIFMYLGHVKVAVNRELASFVRSGPELVFEVMSDVLGVLANSNFYALCFYLYLFLLVFSTIVCTLIGAKNAYVEILPISVKYKAGSRITLITLIYTISFICSSLNLTRGGLHTYEFISTFIGLYSIVLCTILFMVGIPWVFGLKEITEAAAEMGIRLPGVYFQICWKFIAPLVLLTVLFGLFTNTEAHIVQFDGKEIPLGIGLKIVGNMLAIGPLMIVVGGAIHALWKSPGKNFKEKFLTSISPTKEHRDILEKGTGKRATLAHYFYFYARTPGATCNVFCSFQRKAKVAPEIDVYDYDQEMHDSQEEQFSNDDNAPSSRNSLQIPSEDGGGGKTFLSPF